MKRLIALLTGLVAWPLGVAAPPADALGAATCTITGVIHFAPSATAVAEGTWRIGPAAISCNGLSKGPEYFLGQGPFTGSGTYSILPTGTGGCLHQVGRGIVEYTAPTTGTPLRVREEQEFVVAGVGQFTTPSLKGTFVASPPHEGDCITKPVTRATFAAQGVLLRDVPLHVRRHGHH